MNKNFMIHTTVLALLFLSVKSGLNLCKSLQRFNDDHASEVLIEIEFEKFLQDDFPEKETDVGSLEFLGSGWGFSNNVYKTELKSLDRNSSVLTAMQVIRYDSDQHKNKVNTHVQILQDLSFKNPLNLPRCFGCVKIDEPYPTVFIFTEMLEYSLSSSAFKDSYKASSLEKRVGILLSMANSVNVFHKLQVGHFNIKPNSFLCYGEDCAIAKLINYGTVFYFGAPSVSGSDKNYKDPEMLNIDKKLGPSNDIFSLGITYHEIFVNDNDVKTISTNNGDYYGGLLEEASARNEKLIAKHVKLNTEVEAKYQEAAANGDGSEDSLDNPALHKRITDLIETMISLDDSSRPSLDGIIGTLEGILEEMNYENIYLGRNKEELINTVYGDKLLLDNTPAIIDTSIINSRKKIIL